MIERLLITLTLTVAAVSCQQMESVPLKTVKQIKNQGTYNLQLTWNIHLQLCNDGLGECVSFSRCSNTTQFNDGSGFLNIRFGEEVCHYLETCCDPEDVIPAKVELPLEISLNLNEVQSPASALTEMIKEATTPTMTGDATGFTMKPEIMTQDRLSEPLQPEPVQQCIDRCMADANLSSAGKQDVAPSQLQQSRKDVRKVLKI